MVKSIVRVMITGMFVAALGGPSRAQSHMWLVDSGRSDALFSADGTTNYGKTNTTFTIGSARVSDMLNLNEADVGYSRLAFSIYPAVSASPLTESILLLLKLLVAAAAVLIIPVRVAAAQQQVTLTISAAISLKDALDDLGRTYEARHSYHLGRFSYLVFHPVSGWSVPILFRDLIPTGVSKPSGGTARAALFLRCDLAPPCEALAAPGSS